MNTFSRTISALLLLTAMCGYAADENALLFRALARSQEPAKAIALAQRGSAGVQHLVEGLERGGRLAALCAWALYEHPQPEAAPALRGLLWQADQVAGYWAAKALGRMPSPENAEALSRLLPNERLGFWELSAGGVGRLTDVYSRGQRQSVPAQEWMPNLRVAYAAMESLGQIGGEPAAGTLMRALQNDQYLIRFAAVRGLAQMRHLSAEASLQDMAQKDPVLLVRMAARQALHHLGHQGCKTDFTRLSALGACASSNAAPPLPPAIAFIKTSNRSESNLGFRDSYFFPKTPRYHSGENLFVLTPPLPQGQLRNLTGLSDGEVQGPEVSFDGKKLLFAMRRDKRTDGFHIYEIGIDGSGIRQITSGNCNDADPCYLPDGRIAFCSDRAGYQEYYHQERSRALYVMNADGLNVTQITFNPNQDYEPLVLADGRLLYGSYRFYAQDGHEGPLPGERLGLSRIETVLRSVLPDGSGDGLFYGSMRGSFYSPLRSMPFSDQGSGWHPRGYHVGVSISQGRELDPNSLVCVSPAGLTVVETHRAPLDCEIPIFPEVVNLAGGEEVYIHNYDEMNPVGRYTTPYPLDNSWVLVSHAPWHDLRPSGYGIYAMNLATRERSLVYDDPALSDVDPIPLVPRQAPPARTSVLAPKSSTGFIYCNSVLQTDLPIRGESVRYVRVLEGLQMGLSINANAAFRTRVLGTVPLHPDGSFYIEVPADTPIRFELLDADSRMLVHETEFNYVRPGETKGCVGCHEPQRRSVSNARPQALDHPAVRALRERGAPVYMGRQQNPYNTPYRD